jgi:hypothetical protein
LIEELADYGRRYQAAKQAAAELTAGLTDRQLNQRPAAGGWSVAECLDHLLVTGEQVLAPIDAGIDRALKRGWTSSGPFRYGRLGNWFVRSNGGGQPPRRRFKAPSLYQPSPARPAAELVESFGALQARLQQRLERADGVDLARVKISSPVTRLLRLSLGQWFALLAGHQERHLGQARRVLEQIGRG